MIITFVTIAVFLSIENDDVTEKFCTARIFAALALFNQLTVPLFIFPITIPIIINAIVSTRRLEKFLHQPEVQKEFEGIRNMARIMSRSDASLDVFEIDENEGQSLDRNGDNKMSSTSSTPNESLLLSKKSSIISPAQDNDSNYRTPNEFTFNNDDFLADSFDNQSTTELQQQPPLHHQQQHEDLFPKSRDYSRRSFNASVRLKKNNQISASTKLDRNRPRQKSLGTEIQMELSNELIVSIRNAVFSWRRRRNSAETESRLRVDRLDIPRGEWQVYNTLNVRASMCV